MNNKDQVVEVGPITIKSNGKAIDDLLVKLAIVELKLAQAERQLKTVKIKLPQPHWFGDSQIYYVEDIVEAIEVSGYEAIIDELV